MDKRDIIVRIADLGRKILPANGQLWLYGSQARGDSHAASDWDLLVLIDKQKQDFEDFDNYSYPFIELGASLGVPISAHLYTNAEWRRMSFTPFFHNVEHDRKVLIG